MKINEHDIEKKVYKINEIYNGDIFRLKGNDIGIYIRFKYLIENSRYACFNLITNQNVDFAANIEIYKAENPILTFSYKTVERNNKK